MAIETPSRVNHAAEPSVAELVRRASDDLSRLVRDELQLAKLELAHKGKEAGLGAGLLGGGAGFAFFGVAALVTTAILGLATVLAPWLSALIVAVALFVIAAVLALVGRSRLRKSVPPVPEEALASAKADINKIKGSMHR
ncbi:phage holin family protein [Luedemannella flava]|uniref:Phage holin family protein n=1 Tax=Luedemannella flava TaxID=349316 RepID=A0ABP4YGV9_9ACTN